MNQKLKYMCFEVCAFQNFTLFFSGSEKVSGQHIVDELLMNKIVPLLSVPDEILSNYNASDVRIKESLSQAFLLNLSYWEMTKQMEIRR